MGEAGGYRGQVLYDSNSLCPQRREYPSLSSHFPDVVQKENWLKSPQQSRTKNGVRLWQKNSLCLAKHNVQKECHDIMLSRPVGINSKVERSKNNNLKCQRKIVFAHIYLRLWICRIPFLSLPETLFPEHAYAKWMWRLCSRM